MTHLPIDEIDRQVGLAYAHMNAVVQNRRRRKLVLSKSSRVAVREKGIDWGEGDVHVHLVDKISTNKGSAR